MHCELCGQVITGQPMKIWIEGAQLTVCPNCARYGSIIRQKASSKSSQPSPKPRTSQSKLSIEAPMVIKNYGSVIKQAREHLGLTQEQLAKMIGEKESIIRRLETQRMTPTIELAKKLEKVLKVRLLEAPQEDRELPKVKKIELTLGDVAVIKERGKSKS